MEPLVLFVTAFVVGLSGAMMPGPLTVVLVGHSFKSGLRSAPLITLGHGIMEVLIILLLVMGLEPLLSGNIMSGVIGLAGGGILLWMGYGMFRAGKNRELTMEGNASSQKNSSGMENAGPVKGGVWATLANPYWFIWWATVGAGYVVASQEHGLKGLFLFFSGHILSDFLWLLFLAAAVVSGKKLLNRRRYNFILAMLGIFLMGFAGYFFWSGLSFLGVA